MSISPSPPIPIPATAQPSAPGWTFFPAPAKSPAPAAEPTRKSWLRAGLRAGADRSGMVLAGQWELRRRLGAGGMGEVYEATYLADRRPYAVKILASKYAADETMAARFQHEFWVLRRAEHRNIVAAHAFIEDDGERFYSMELLDGEPLDRMIKRGPLPVERALVIGLQLCDGVGHLHGLGAIHRDLKPGNIFVTKVDGEDVVKLLDLGVCKLTPRWYADVDVRTLVDDRVHTKTGVMLGTPGYIGTKSDDGDVESEVLLDVFGLGVTLFQVITGRMPYKGSPPRKGEEPQWAAKDRERVPEVLADVIDKAIAVDPVARYQRIEELRDGLEQAAMELGVIPCDAEGLDVGGGASEPAAPQVTAAAAMVIVEPEPGRAEGPGAQISRATGRAPAGDRRRGIAAGVAIGLVLGAVLSLLVLDRSEGLAGSPLRWIRAVHAAVATAEADGEASGPVAPPDAMREVPTKVADPGDPPLSLDDALAAASTELRRCAALTNGLLVIRFTTEESRESFTAAEVIGPHEEAIARCVRLAVEPVRFTPTEASAFTQEYTP